MSQTTAGALDPRKIFKTLQCLSGRWSGTNEEGQPVFVTYFITANGTALVEDWKFHNGDGALTIYHLDGNTLMAMHYCPLGNQPRLDLKRQRTDGTLEFECVSATNMKSLEDPHEHSFDLKINEDGSIHRNETYVEIDGKLLSNGTLFRRVM